jgi:tRNA pseudouridine38-40 synthase
MPRYFIEVAYKGTIYAGFQKQDNANSIQTEVEKALSTYFRSNFSLTGSSRTDTGVHARQNFFHFDSSFIIDNLISPQCIYHLNAILPLDIVVKSIRQVKDNAHCRFDAQSRTYEYRVYQNKNPFLQDTSYYYPYKVELFFLQQLADELMSHTDFESFSKRNTQVHTHKCTIYASAWEDHGDYIVYRVKANRFLRGMVKGLVGTMLRTASKHQTLDDFRFILHSKNSSKVDFSVAAHGLTLIEVAF